MDNNNPAIPPTKRKLKDKILDYAASLSGHRDELSSMVVVRMQPVVEQLERLNGNIERLVGLYELQLQQVNKLTTRIVHATPAELSDTLVGYNDPELFDAIERMEVEGGRKLTDDELARVVKAWSEESEAAS